MKIIQRPTRTTILFGLICGLLFIPLNQGLWYIIAWSTVFRITLWCYLASYALLLARWGGKRLYSIMFPVLILLISAFALRSNSAFSLLALGIFSWIRSGICFQKRLSSMLVAEIFLTLGGGLLVAWFRPHTTLTWALGIWMFFLVQSLYFVIFEEKNKEAVEGDPFEAARLGAEKILSARLYS